MPARYYYLGPWQPYTEPAQTYVFRGETRTVPAIPIMLPPDGTVGLVDLRPPNGTGGYGFFATDQPLGSDYEPFGDGINRLEDITLTAQRRSKWASMLGMPSLASANLLNVLWETLTVQADPAGVARALPIMPTHLGMLELHLAGHSLLRAQRLTRKHPAFATVCRALQASYARINSKAPKLAAKWLEVQRRKLRLAPGEAMNLLIPAGLPKQRPQRPTTVIQDDFNRDDDFAGLEASAEGWAWSEQTGFGLYNQLAMFIADITIARAEVDLSSDDHYSQVDIVNMPRIGVIVRATTQNVYSGTNSYYSYIAGTNATSPSRLYKTIDNNAVAIDGGATHGGSPVNAGQSIRLACDGSTLTGYVNGQQSIRITDTAITGNLRCGLRGVVGMGQVDNFVAADLIAAGKKQLVGGDFF